MNEAEWLACTDLTPMLEFLRGKASERKLRLTETSSTTVASPASTFAAAGCWTSCWGRSNVMTEKEWLACTDPNRMLTFLRRKTSDRKLRLFACGCCRQIWKDLTLKTVRRAVETAESYADGSVSDHELKQAHTKGVIVCTEMLHRGTVKMMNDPAYSLKMCRMGLAVNVAHDAPFQIGQLDLLGTDDFLKSVSPVLLRCVIGNPFRPLPPKRGKQQWK